MNWLTKAYHTLLNDNFIAFQKGIFKYTSGSILLIGLFFISCSKEKSTLGLEDQESDLPIDAILIDTLTVEAQTVLIKSLANSKDISALDDPNTSDVNEAGPVFFAGGFDDPIFGDVTATAYTQMALRYENIEMQGAVVDSVYLYLDYDRASGDTLETQTFEIYKLNEYLDTAVFKYSHSTPPAIGSLLGSATFSASPKSSNYISIKLNDNTWAQSIVDGPKKNKELNDLIYGIAIKPTDNNGAALRINGNGVNTKIRIYTKQYGVAKNYDLLFNSSVRRYTHIDYDRSATNFSTLVNDYDSLPSGLADKLYLQTTSAITPRIRIPYLSSLRTKLGEMNILRAHLVVEGNTGSNTTYAPPNFLYLVECTKDGKLKYAEGKESVIQADGYNQYLNSNPLIVQRNFENYTYTFPVRSYVNALMYGTKKNNGLFIRALENASTLKRAYLEGTSDSNVKRIRLKLYVTLNK